MECINGHQVSEGASFCPACGISVGSTKGLLCSNSHNNTLDARVCVVCGVDTFKSNYEMVRKPFNRMAVAALVAAWCPIVPFLGVFLGFKAIKQIRETGERGIGLARAGIILGIVTGLLFIAMALPNS